VNELEIYIDGASKGNPGPSGIGVVLCKGGETIRNVHAYIGEATNNIAEYNALLFGLREALNLKAQKVTINTDSELLYRQIKRIYKVKNPNISKLYDQAVELIGSFKEVNFNHIPRKNNKGADKLANLAIKGAKKFPAGSKTC